MTAGQFLNWRFLTGPGWTRAHPYSLSAAPDGRSLRITVKTLGDGSALVRSLRPGTRAIVEGPYGRLTERPRTRPRVAFIGAGVGITPLRALAEALPYAPGDAVLLQRATRRPLFAREFDILARERGLQLLWLPGRRRSPDSWLGEEAPADDLTLLPLVGAGHRRARRLRLRPAGVDRRRPPHARRRRPAGRAAARRELRMVTR